MAPSKRTSRGKSTYSKYYDSSDRSKGKKSVAEAKYQTSELAKSVKKPAKKLNRKRPAGSPVSSYIKKRNEALDY